MHVHVYTPSGEAKYWMTPQIELAMNNGLKASELKTAERKIKEHENEINDAWAKHFG